MNAMLDMIIGERSYKILKVQTNATYMYFRKSSNYHGHKKEEYTNKFTINTTKKLQN